MPLPEGLTLNALTGAITGTPTEQGTFAFTLRVTDAIGNTRDVPVEMDINEYTAMALTGTLPLATKDVAYTGSYTLTGGAGPFVYSISAGALPTGLSIDGSTGVISGTPTNVGTYNFTVHVTDDIGQVVTKAGSLFVPLAPSISGSAINGTRNVAYSRTFSTSNGNPPYTYSVASGSLPPGLSLNAATGVLSGTPTTAGNYTFVIRSTDTALQTSDTGSQTPEIFAVPTLTGTAQRGMVGASYSFTPTQNGGSSPFTYSVLSGSLPTGLSLNTSTGAITGTPTVANTYAFTLRSTDSLGNTCDSAAQSVQIIAALALSGTLNSTVLPGVAYSSSITASNGWTPYAWDISVGTLPTGLSLNASTGVVSGTPSGSGTSNFTMRVTDADGNVQTSAQSLTVTGALSFDAGYSANTTVGLAYSSSPTVSGGSTPYSYSLLSGSLPTGLSLNASTGVISGTPTVAGTYNFTIRVTDNAASSADKANTVTVAATLAFAGSYTNKGTLTVAYSSSPSTTGGRAPVTFAVQTGSLPTSLSLNASTGEISGTPTVNGTYNFTIRATDANGKTVDQAVSCVVASYPTLTGSYARGCVGTSYSDSITGALGHTPYTYTKTGTSPSGLTMSSSTNTLSGTPTGSATTYNFTVRLTDAAGNIVDSAQSVQIAAAVSFGSVTLNTVTQGSAFSQTITATGGYTPRTYSISAGSLPTGLSLNGSTGAITGTPTGSGSYSFTLRATDADGNIGSKAFSGTIVVPVTVVANNDTLDGAGDRTVFEQGVAQYSVNSNGTLSWYTGDTTPASGTYSGQGVTAGSASDVEYRVTKTSGSALTSGTLNSWRNMATNPDTYKLSTPNTFKACSLLVEFRRASDSVALDSATIDMTAEA